MILFTTVAVVQGVRRRQIYAEVIADMVMGRQSVSNGGRTNISCFLRSGAQTSGACDITGREHKSPENVHLAMVPAEQRHCWTFGFVRLFQAEARPGYLVNFARTES
jgi:hypothetical protein